MDDNELREASRKNVGCRLAGGFPVSFFQVSFGGKCPKQFAQTEGQLSVFSIRHGVNSCPRGFVGHGRCPSCPRVFGVGASRTLPFRSVRIVLDNFPEHQDWWL